MHKLKNDATSIKGNKEAHKILEDKVSKHPITQALTRRVTATKADSLISGHTVGLQHAFSLLCKYS